MLSLHCCRPDTWAHEIWDARGMFGLSELSTLHNTHCSLLRALQYTTMPIYKQVAENMLQIVCFWLYGHLFPSMRRQQSGGGGFTCHTLYCNDIGGTTHLLHCCISCYSTCVLWESLQYKSPAHLATHYCNITTTQCCCAGSSLLTTPTNHMLTSSWIIQSTVKMSFWCLVWIRT